MKTFAYWIGVLVIVAVMFAIPILATLSFCFNWDFIFKGLFTSFSVLNLVIVTMIFIWFVDDLSDD